MLEAPTLLSPGEGNSFNGWNANIIFEWYPASRPLNNDEYYVLIIRHRKGAGFIWTKETRVNVQESNLQWLSGEGPEILWKVVVAKAQELKENADPTGSETSSYSDLLTFKWYGGDTGSTGTTTDPDPKPSDPGRQPPDNND